MRLRPVVDKRRVRRTAADLTNSNEGHWSIGDKYGMHRRCAVIPKPAQPSRRERPDSLNLFSGLRDQQIAHFVLPLAAARRLPARPAAVTRSGASTNRSIREVRTITSARELELFDKLWSDRTAETESALRLFYKISIYRNGRSVRWLYDPAGLAQVLSKAKKPVYRLQWADDLNALLAISSHANWQR
jgi:hypothetical protein